MINKQSVSFFERVLFVTFLTIVSASYVVFLHQSVRAQPEAATQITSHASADEYHAVFLDNQQVYFAKITAEDPHTIVLEDVFYLENALTTEREGISDNVIGDQLKLIKLGDEFHGPTDRIVINRDHAIFYEQMKRTSEIYSAIVTFKSQ